MTMNKINSKKIITYLLSLLAAAALMYFSFKDVKWADFLSTLKQCKWGCILASMVAGVLAFWFRGMRWRELILPIDPSMPKLASFNAVNIGYLANFVFPRIGECVRCGYITSNSQDGEDGRKLASYDKVTAVLERSWDMVMMILIFVVLLLFKWSKFGAFVMDNMFAPLAGRFDTSAVVLIVAALGVLSAAGVGAIWAVYKFRERNALCAKLFGLVDGVFKGLSSCVRMERKWPFFAYTFLIWLMYYLMSLFTMNAIPSLSELNGVDALFLMIAGSLGWLVPVPGGFGAFHYIVALALSTIYSLGFADGIVFATLSHEAQAVTMILFGLVSFLYESFKKSPKA